MPDSKMEKAIKRMYFFDRLFLVLFELTLVSVLSSVLSIVWRLAPDSTTRVVAVSASGALAVASILAVTAVLRHLSKNHAELNSEDIKYKKLGESLK